LERIVRFPYIFNLIAKGISSFIKYEPPPPPESDKSSGSMSLSGVD
jgi:hypothetical protein